MLYIFSAVSALFILIAIFFIKINLLIYISAALFIINIIITKSIYRTVKRLMHLIPYFLAILIIQALNSRGEYYTVFGIYLDKAGVDFTIAYFLRIASVLYFLSIFFFIINMMRIPSGYFFDEMIRISIFMKIVRKSFLFELSKIADKDKSFKEKLNLIKNLIDNVYSDSFKFYPYDIFLHHYRNIKK